MTGLWSLYYRTYDFICGEHPYLRPWHFQWLAAKDLYRDLRKVLATLEGRVLDVGCGDKPYLNWCSGAKEFFGIDIQEGPEVDLVIEPDQRWDLEDASFDAVLCTQVIEHATDRAHLLEEIGRVLRPGGRFVLTAPFIYNEHGQPHDYRRFSVFGLQECLAEDYEVREVKRQGRIGSTCGVLLLNWMEAFSNRFFITRLLKGILMPVWILWCLLVALAALLMDAIDGTQEIYLNSQVVAVRRKSRAEPGAETEEGKISSRRARACRSGHSSDGSA